MGEVSPHLRWQSPERTPCPGDGAVPEDFPQDFFPEKCDFCLDGFAEVVLNYKYTEKLLRKQLRPGKGFLLVCTQGGGVWL